MARADGLLRGGTANYGRIVRVGNTVHRPVGAHTPAVHDLLRYLAAREFAGAPRVVELGDDHEVLQYVEGSAAAEPLDPALRSDEALASVGALLRTFHDAVIDFAPGNRPWQGRIPPRWRGSTITHNDPNPGNVVFRNGRAVALIDFDLAGPGSPAWDLAVTACCWIPLQADVDIDDERVERRFDRLGVLLDGYGADHELRRLTVDACADATDWMAGVIREAGRRGHPAFGRLWDARGRTYVRATDWIRRNHARLQAAATS